MTLDQALWQDPERMSGAICFRDTRVPLAILFDYLEADGVPCFLDNYPNVRIEQVQAVLDDAYASVVQDYTERKAA